MLLMTVLNPSAFNLLALLVLLSLFSFVSIFFYSLLFPVIVRTKVLGFCEFESATESIVEVGSVYFGSKIIFLNIFLSKKNNKLIFIGFFLLF